MPRSRCWPASGRFAYFAFDGFNRSEKSHVVEKLFPNMVCDSVHDFGAVVSRIDVHAERSCSEWHVYHLDDCLGDIKNIGIGLRGNFKALHDLGGQCRSRAGLILGKPLLICRRTA